MSLVNFRDPAALADPDGHWVRPGALYRSAQPYPAADPVTVELLTGSGIRTVIDLRGDAEADPADWAAAAAAGIEIVEARIQPTNPALEASMREMTTAADLGAFYLLMAESAPASVARAVEAAARPGGALLHCAAGKDRTGLLVALLLDLVGVPAEEIVADYARTNEALTQIFEILAERNRSALNDYHAGSLTVPAPLLEAPAGAMVAFLELVAARYGGTEGFLAHCGVEAATIETFRAKAAAPAAPATAASATAGAEALA
ncbi:tyrosine-protein phosphatase [Streptomyces sp. BE20]|uniref:tyrosine-protein phosphatase n=1 Tax=Streptomyces sp. BE20 TaxID=3002525 RepID=UPI002E77A840|nr:tyrosine-protein phosphatase [Streptomyces sp. BE20]MEE1825832.1 tyrosine-protein phosphatase [Streptomyces sp. BE20]